MTASEKIKNEVIRKIRELQEVCNERDEMESEADEQGMAYAELKEENVEYACLCRREIVFRDEIDELIIDTKYAPLCFLTKRQIKDLDFFIESSNLGLESEQMVQTHLDYKLKKFTGEIKDRLKKVKPLCLITSPFDQRTYQLYDEIIRCYVLGAFQACCILSRATAEFMANNYIDRKGFGKWLTWRGKQGERLTTKQILSFKDLNTPRKIIDIYDRVGSKANHILHKANEKTEELDALHSIELLQSLIEAFHKTP